MILQFDVRSYLDYKGIPYQAKGSSFSRGWVNTKCVFCSDHAIHLGINLKTGIYRCWLCGKKGGPQKLVSTIENCGFIKAERIIADFKSRSLDASNEQIRMPVDSDILPPEATDRMLPVHRKFLNSRRFDPLTITSKYKLRFCNHNGDFKFRIIIPLIMGGKVVNFVARDPTGQSSEPYMNCKNEKSIVSVGECLYNIDSVKDTIILVEGVTDVWRIGDGAVATMGIDYTREQIAILADMSIKRAFIMYDGEEQAIKQANKLGSDLSGFIPKVYVYELESGDPDDLSDEEVIKLRREIF